MPEDEEKKSPTVEKQGPRQPTQTSTRNEDKSESGSSSSMSKEEAESALRVQIPITNQQLPMDLGVGIVITRMYLSGNYVMYLGECDENKISITEMDNNKTEVKKKLKQTLRSMISSKQDEEFFNLCLAADKGIGYTYIGDQTGKKVTVYIGNDELRLLAK